jgi:carbon storage regulator
MLVLTRKLNQVIVIGDNIRIRVLALAGGRIRLGIEAPEGVRIVREELLTAIESAPIARTLDRNRDR